MKGGAHPSPFAALSFANSKKVPIYCWFDRERVFQSSHGEAQPRTHTLRRLSAPNSTMQNVTGPIRFSHLYRTFFLIILVGRITFYRRHNLIRSKSITRVQL